MVVKTLVKKTSPLCFLQDGKLLSYQHGDIIVFDNGQEQKRFTLFKSKKERILGRFKLASRLLRLGIRSAEVIDDSTVVLSIGNILYELNINNGLLSQGFICGKGIRPLIFTTVKGIDGMDEGIYFGGYLGNLTKESVDVYYRIGVDKWKVVYTFPKGTINHVHNIVADPYRQCLWIFTGDFDESSAIWKVTDNFKKVERVVCNDQKYRGCVVFAIPEGLIYATDAPFADDFIYLLNPDTKDIKKIHPIDGSCIYGCQWKDLYVFSSTVEGDGRNMSRLEWLFTRKRGAGIKDNHVHMYIGNPQEGFREVYKLKKDCMPFYTFQFGVFKFPYGVNNGDTLYFQPVATTKHDLDLMSIDQIF